MKFPLRKLSRSWVAPHAIMLGTVLIFLIWFAIKIEFTWTLAVILVAPLILRFIIIYVPICFDIKRGYKLVEDSAATILRYGVYSRCYPTCEIKKLLLDK